MRDHLPCCDEECREFRFGGRSHDELDYLGDGEDCPVEAGKWVIFGEINVSASATAGVGLVEEASIGMCAEYHVTRSVDNPV